MTTELDATLRIRLVDEVTATGRQIASELGAVGAAATRGGATASASFEDLRVRELQARDSVRQLRGEMRALQATGAVSEAGLRELAGELVRAEEEARGLAAQARDAARAQREMAAASGAASNAAGSLGDLAGHASAAAAETTGLATAAGGLTRASGGTASAARSTGAAMSLLSQESKNHGREMGGLVNVVAELGYSFGSVVPGMREAGTQMAMLGGTAYQAGAAFGPWGVAIGTLIGALPMLIPLLMDTEEETTDAAEAAERMANAQKANREETERLVAALRLQRAEQAIASGLGTGEQTGEALDAANERLETARAVLAGREQRLARDRERVRELEAEQAGGGMFNASLAQRLAMQERIAAARETVRDTESKVEGAQTRVTTFEQEATRAAERHLVRRATEIEEDRVGDAADEDADVTGFERRETRARRRADREYWMGSSRRPTAERVREVAQRPAAAPDNFSAESVRLLGQIANALERPRPSSESRVRVEVEDTRVRVRNEDSLSIDGTAPGAFSGQG